MTPANSPPAQLTGLPARPNLEYLKKLAKERLRSLRADDPSIKLARAQLAIARDYGFASWRQLKAHVEQTLASVATWASANLAAKVAAFLAAAVSHHTEERPIALHKAEALLAAEPRIAKANLLTACVLGDTKTAAALLERESPTASAGPNNWPPLLYLAFSRYLHFRPKLESQFVRIARMLIDRGADPNSHFVHEGFNETALYGAAGISNRPKLTKLLLDAGADPDDGGENSGMESLYHACEHTDNASLKLLLAKHPRADAVSYCLARKLDFEDVTGARLMLDHGADPNYQRETGGNRVLHAIRRGRSVAILKLLHKYGGNLDAADEKGMTPLKLARRLGEKETVRYLMRAGAKDSSDQDGAGEQFLTACAAGRRDAAVKLLRQRPDLISRLGPEDLRILTDAAAANHLAAVRLMLDLGFDINAKGDWGAAIHHAVWSGHTAMVKLLIRRGANLQQKNGFGGDALGTAIHGALHARHKQGPQIIALVAAAMKVTDMTPYLKAAFDGEDPAIIEAVNAIAAKRQKSAVTNKAWKPIMDASFRGDAAAGRRLLQAGADPNVISATAQRYRPLHHAIEPKKLTKRGEQHVEVVRALLESGADPMLRGTWDQLTALQLAATGDFQFVALLRKFFEPLDIFHAAAVGDDGRVAVLLKQNRALATAKDVNGWTPLHYCCASASYKLGKPQSDALVRIAKMLLKQGADPMATYAWNNEWPIPPLYHCCGRHNNPALAVVLFEAGATPYDNETVYHAADEDHQECLALIEKYADPRLLAAECSKCLSTQLHWGHSRGAAWLLVHGADPNWLSPRFGDSALHAAVKRGSGDKVLQMLLHHGADPKRKNSGGKSAIDLAKGKPRIAAVLRNATKGARS